METRASYVLIGAFTLAVLVLGFLFVLWIGKLQLDREWDWYDVVFKEAVTGLTVGGAVQYNGIQVGEVRRLSLGVDNPSEVIARVRLNGGTPVKTDTRAKLTFTGITGVAIIQLSGGSPEAPMLADRSGERIAQIVADESAIQKLLASSEDIVTSVNDLLFKLSVLLRQENIDRITATVKHVEAITGETAAHAGEIGRAITDISEASRALRATLSRTEAMVTKLEALADNSNRLIDDEGRALLVAARTSLESARRFTDSADVVVKENRAAVAGLANQGAAQVGPAIAELRAALRNLQRLADQLGNDPSAVLHGPEKLKEYDAR
jgi:phospholipid/cholesterol/gamma-HCH transport system substrate-binding protein